MEAAIDDGKSEFERTVRAYNAELYRYAFWLCRDGFVAEELVQQTFARAWKSWAKLRDPDCAKAWLITILRNERARMHARKQIPVADQDVSDIEIPDLPSMDEDLDMKQRLERLPSAYREPLLLQILGGFSCSEIAAILATTEGAVMTRLTRARMAMRKEPTVPAMRKVGK